MSIKTQILITIDTEYSIGGHFKDSTKYPVPAERIIFCRIGEQEYGINLIMDILDRYDFKGVFFVEVEARFYFGEDEIIKTIRHIKNRGHEVQLHTHPNFRAFRAKKRTPDDFRKYTFSEQKNILEEALAFLSSHGIVDILAHRSGGFYSNQDTVKAQKECGIKYSSNYNLAFPNCDYIKITPLINDLYETNGVYEAPITNFQEYEIRKKWNAMQLSAASLSEMKAVLNFSYQTKTRIVTFITHSFEFVKAGDDQYSTMKPLRIFINRFEKICNYISINSDKFEVITFATLDQNLKEDASPAVDKPASFYKSSLFRTGCRYLENACTRLI